MKRFLFLLPLMIALAVGGIFYWGLSAERDPNHVPSVHLHRPMPEFILAGIPDYGAGGFDPAQVAAEDIALVNFFASWCTPCRAEHSVLSKLAKERSLPLYGINYKDDAKAAVAWLTDLGDSYKRIGFDEAGRAGLQWGVAGIPETFLIKKGEVVFRHAGPIVGDRAIGELLDALREADAR